MQSTNIRTAQTLNPGTFRYVHFLRRFANSCATVINALKIAYWYHPSAYAGCAPGAWQGRPASRRFGDNLRVQVLQVTPWVPSLMLIGRSGVPICHELGPSARFTCLCNAFNACMHDMIDLMLDRQQCRLLSTGRKAELTSLSRSNPTVVFRRLGTKQELIEGDSPTW